jgi:hypothetical protein
MADRDADVKLGEDHVNSQFFDGMGRATSPDIPAPRAEARPVVLCGCE